MKAYSFVSDVFLTNQAASGAAGTGEIVEFQSTRRATINLIQSRWQKNIVSRLTELCALPEGWDGYSGKPVTYEIACYAQAILSAMGEHFCREVSITPCSNGELFLEWHLHNGDIELHLQNSISVDGYFRNILTGEEKDEEFIDNFAEVYKWLEVMYGGNGEKLRSTVH